jgi:hypothetical protein
MRRVLKLCARSKNGRNAEFAGDRRSGRVACQLKLRLAIVSQASHMSSIGAPKVGASL